MNLWTIFIGLWTNQMAVMFLWSILCFCMGICFCTTCYWYRIRYVMRHATAELDKHRTTDMEV